MKPKFTQYPHIENLDEMPGIFDLPEVVVTEKVHGSGARIAVIENQLHIGGRKLEFTDIRPDNRDGLCFIQWVLDTGLDKRMLEAFRNVDVVLYGEWHGSGTPKKNWPQVQKGITYIKGNDLRIFDAKVDGRYVPFDEITVWAARAGLKTMPVLYRGRPDNEKFYSLVDTMSKVGEENGIVDKENTIEGIVIRPPELLWDEKGNVIMAKLKIGKWAERASQQKNPNQMKPKPKDVIPGAEEFAREFVTDTRMDHVLDQLREEGKPIDKSSMGDVMRLMGQDVKREGAKALEDAGLEWKDVSTFVTKFTKELFLKSKIPSLLVTLAACLALCGVSYAADISDIDVGDRHVGEEIAPPKAFDAGVDFDFVSRYLWRGIYFSDGALWQPSAWASKWGFTPSVWGNYVLGNESDQWKFNEVDLGLTYAHELAGLTVKPGFIYYLYPYATERSTGEASLYLAYPIGPFNIFTLQTVDIKGYRGAYYADFGACYEKKINDSLTVQALASMAWASDKFNDSYFAVPETTVDNFNFTVSLNAKLLPYLYVRPHLQYTVLVNDDLRNAYEEPNLYNIGVAIGATY